MTRLRLLGISAGVIVVGLTSLAVFGPVARHDEFCPAYAVGVPLDDDERVRSGGFVIRDHSYRDRDACGDDDLWHYPPHTLAGVDGVLFSDCTISWVGGGHSSADEIGLACPT